MVPRGDLLPVLCRNIIWSKISALPANGTRKWREKNRLKVGLSTLYAPHTQITTVLPTYGIALIRFVITVAPQ